MPTSSLLSICRLFHQQRVKPIATGLTLPFPVSVRELIDRSSSTLLAGWELVTTETIARDPPNNVWHAGHVEDVFPLDDGRVLIATWTGGLWLSPIDGSSAALPLSNSWRDVDMHCLGAGPRSARHVYAGGINVLYETAANSLRALANFKKAHSVKTIAAGMGQSLPVSLRGLMQLAPDAPVLDWRRIPIVDTEGDALVLDIRQVLTVTDIQPPKLVLATDSGVFWSDVPAFGQDYQFSSATGIPGGQCLAVALSSRAAGVSQFVVCSPTGSVDSPQSNGIYFGTWQGDNLVLQRATHLGNVDFVQWAYAVVASSAGNRSILYAAVAESGTATLRLLETFRKASIVDPPLKVTRLAQLQGVPFPVSLAALIRKVNPPQGVDGIYAVLSSADGGATWSPAGPNQRVEESIVSLDLNVTQGGYNISIAVSHANPDIVALGWRRGPSIGKKTPGAFRWEEHGDGPPGFSPHIHSDSHGLHFDPHDPSGNTLFACSDGGIAFTRDLCVTFASIINRNLTNLEFQGYPAHIGGFPGASGASPHNSGLLAGALQDNGLVFTFRVGGAQKPWTTIEGGDGLLSLVLENDRFLLWNNSEPLPPAPANRTRTAKWNGTGLDVLVDVLVGSASPSVPSGQTFDDPFAEPVLQPGFRKPGNRIMYAVAAYDANKTAAEIWGLFADPDGSNPTWEFLTGINPAVNGAATAVASADGRTVLIGTAKGRMLSYDSPSGVLKTMNIDAAIFAPAGQVYQFSFVDSGVAIARFANTLLRFDPQRNFWTSVGANGLPNDESPLQFTAVDSVRSPNILYTATDYGVHASWDAGANWLPVSQGLPVRSHPSTLRFVAEPDGSRHLYLFTYGRSAWKTRLN